MARDQLERCDVAALVIDARMGATAEDAKLAGEIEASGRCAIVVLNKKDLVGRADMDKQIETTRETLAFLRYAPVLVTSAVTRAGVTGIVTEAARVFGRRRGASPPPSSTSCSRTSSPPSRLPRAPTAGTCACTTPPRPAFARRRFSSAPTIPTDITHAYRRFLINQLRKAHGFEGTPIKLIFRAHSGKRQGQAKPGKEKVKRG